MHVLKEAGGIDLAAGASIGGTCIEISFCYVGTIFDGSSHKCVYGIGQQHVVTVDKHDVFASDIVQTPVPGTGKALVVLMYDLYVVA